MCLKKSSWRFGFIVLLFIGTATFSAFGQISGIDSLKSALNNTTNDSVKTELLSRLVEIVDEEELPELNRQMKILIIKQLKKYRNSAIKYRYYNNLLASSYMNDGFTNSANGNIYKAPDDYLKALKIYEELELKAEAALCHNEIASAYQDRGDIVSALEHFHRSLKINESLNKEKDIARNLNNIGSIYIILKDYTAAITYYTQALKIHEKTGNKNGEAQAINNLGVAYHYMKNYSKALEHYQKSLELREKAGNKKAIPMALMNIGTIYKLDKNYAKALSYFNKALELNMEINDRKSRIEILTNLGLTYGKTGNKTKAIEFCKKGLEIALEKKYPIDIAYSSEILAGLYKNSGDHKNALLNYELYIKMRDSINNESTRKASIKSQLKYEYEKQAAADSVAHAKESEIKNVQLQKQTAEIKAKKNQQYALFGGLALVMVFAGFMFNRFKVTQKQKSIIEEQKTLVEEQKHLVEEKQKEVMDSIRYAQRIQRALLPSEKYITRILDGMKKR